VEPDDYGEPEIDRLLQELGIQLPDVEGDAEDDRFPQLNDDDNMEEWEWR
jgi:hypothetical protein